ncbi:MAG TPA: M14 family metallopeptidase [Vicinamibacterales bacterium]
MRMQPMTALLWLGAALLVACAVINAQHDEPRSVAERSGFTETSRLADVRAFIDALATGTSTVHVETFGTSEEGRALPLVVIGDPPGRPDPSTSLGTKQTRLPVVLVMANIHAGEVEGKEATLHLMRRLTRGDLQPLLKAAVWLFVPIYNADGNEKISLENRTEQNGPIGGVGTRENANGLDLNRDFMKLESAEARALVALMTRWDPDVVVDLHTTNGSYHGYHLTYAPALNPNADARIIGFTRDKLLASVRRAMASRHDFRVYDYGNFAHVDSLGKELEGFATDDARAKAWRTFDERPRFGNNYIGLRNRIAVLSEAYSYLDFERRVKVTEAFVEEIMRFVAANAAEIRSLTGRSDSEWSRTRAPREAGVAFELRPLPRPVDVLVGAVGTAPNPRSGKPMTTMVESVAVPTKMTVYDRFVPTVSRRVPSEYVVRSSSGALLESVARVLAAHGIRVDRVSAPARRSADQFVIDRVAHAERAFQGHHETTVTGRFEHKDVEVPPGSLVIRTDQRLGRLVFYLLEPESNDGLGTWNVFDGALMTGQIHPVLKVF